MGRFLSAGIPAKITICDTVENIDKQGLNKLIKEIKKYVKLNHYETTVYDNGYTFKLDTDFFNNNIHEAIKSFYKKTEFYPRHILDWLSDEPIKLDKNFNQNNYPITLTYDYEKKYKGTEGLILQNEFLGFERQFPPEYWIIYDAELPRYYNHNYKIEIEYITIWSDLDKYVGEDESNMLRLLNKFKTKVLAEENPLIKNIMFFISG